MSISRPGRRERRRIPLRLELGKGLALGVVADVANVDEAAQVELLGPELRHGGQAIC